MSVHPQAPDGAPTGSRATPSSCWLEPLHRLTLVLSLARLIHLVETQRIAVYLDADGILWFDRAAVIAACVRHLAQADALKHLRDEESLALQRAPKHSVRALAKLLRPRFPGLTYGQLLKLAHDGKIPIEPVDSPRQRRYHGRCDEVAAALERIGSDGPSDAITFEQTMRRLELTPAPPTKKRRRRYG